MSFAQSKGISVQQVLSEYTAVELDYWKAWGLREISDNKRIESLLAQLISIQLNINSSKGSKKSKPNDFIFKSNWLSDERSDSQTIINEFIKGMS